MLRWVRRFVMNFSSKSKSIRRELLDTDALSDAKELKAVVGDLKLVSERLFSAADRLEDEVDRRDREETRGR